MSISNIKSKKHLLFPFLSFAALSSLIFGGNLLGSGKFPISWTPDKATKDQFIGTSQIVSATFKSNKDLKNVKFWLTPRLSKYTKVEPETIAKIEKNKEYDISIIVSVPADFQTKKHEKDDFKDSLKSYLSQDFDEKEYNSDFKNNEEFLKDFSANTIRGLLFVAEEKQTRWPDFIKQKRTVRKVYPLPLKIVLNVKRATAQDVLEPFEVDSDPTKVVISEGVKFIVNEIVILLKDEAELSDAIQIAGLVNGLITGFVPTPPTYKIEMETATATELNNIISQIKNSGNPLIIEAIPNFISQ